MTTRPCLPVPSHRLAPATMAIGLGLLLAGCSILGNKPKDAPTVYAPDPRSAAAPEWPSVKWQLGVTAPASSRSLDSVRIAVRPNANELQVYKGATWAKPPSAMLVDSLLRTLEDSGHIPVATRAGSGINTDYRLVLDIRRFESAYTDAAAMPSATIEVNAKLMHVKDQQVVASRTFLQAQPASATAVPAVVEAFDRALGALTGQMAGWVLASGEAHERGVHR